MKKEYNHFVNNQNTPNLKLYTKLLGIFYGSLSLNCFIAFVYTKFFSPWGNISFLWLVLSITMFVMIFAATADPRKANRDLFAVISAGTLWTIGTLTIAWFLRFYGPVVAYIIELSLVLVIIKKSKEK